ncbi:MAG: chlorophyll a/b-binding protein [Cyanobacteria bacterium P01_H01_bin.153]
MTSDPQDTQTNSTESTSAESTDTNAVESAAPGSTTKTTEAPSFGWNAYAERINGRFAMVGFVALLLVELFTHQDFFTWLGF